MAQIIQEEIRKDLGCVLVTIEDDEGERTVHPVYFRRSNCATCGMPYVLDGDGHVDMEQTKARLVEQMEAATDHYIAFSEKNGYDVSELKAKVQERINGKSSASVSAGIANAPATDGAGQPQG